MFVVLSVLALATGSSEPIHSNLFQSGTEGYHTFRIPALVSTPRHTLLAFAEGRKSGRGDSGDIDVVLKRSVDRGRTWQPLQIVADDGENTVGNPCPVVDRTTGIVWLLLTHNLGKDTERAIRDGTSKGTRRVWVTHSKDDGLTWAKPLDVTDDVKAPNWTWYATGPGIGIQTKSGRLVIPCDHSVAGSKAFHSHVLLSDDHGKSWKRGGVVGEKTNECQVIERRDGSLLLNARSYHGKNRRAIATSDDGGTKWSSVRLDKQLIEPVCQASLLRLPGGEVLFSNPASKKREKLTIRQSEDDGTTWPTARVLYEGPSAYSCLAHLSPSENFCLYERGKKSPYESITLARFSLDWLKER